MKIRLGVAPIAWTNSDLPELGGDVSLEQCLRESRAAGYSGTETGVKFPLDASTLGPILAEHELRLVSGWFSGCLLTASLDEEKRRLEPQLDCFAQLGARVMVYAETSGSIQTVKDRPVRERPRLTPDEISSYGEKLTALAEHMQARGVPMAYHHHMGTVIETEADIDALMAGTGAAVGLALDTGHVTYAGGDVLAIIERHGARINHVHCKDVRDDVLERAHAADMSFLESVIAGVFTVPGDGCIDFAGVAQKLADARYRGWVVVEAEQDPEKAPPFEYAKLGHAHLSDVFVAAGFKIAH